MRRNLILLSKENYFMMHIYLKKVIFHLTICFEFVYFVFLLVLFIEIFYHFYQNTEFKY